MNKILQALQKSQEEQSWDNATPRQINALLTGETGVENARQTARTSKNPRAGGAEGAASDPVRQTSRGIDEHLIAFHNANAPATEQYRRLFIEIIRAGKLRQLRTLLLSSALAGEGKTTTALNLAATIAMSGATGVLLVETDFRRPNIHRLLGTRPACGLADYVLGEVTYSQLFVKTPIPALTVVHAGRLVSNPTALLRSERIGQFFQEVQAHADFSYVILDSSPILLTAEPSALIQYVDAVILVVRARKSPREMVAKAIEIVKAENILGCICNGITPSDSDCYQYYSADSYYTSNK